MSRVILICGKICSGKSAYAKRLCDGGKAVLLSVDEIMLSLFGQHTGERHDEYAEKTKNYLLEKSLEILKNEINVVLDWGFWTKRDRNNTKLFYASRNIECELHYIAVDNETWQEFLYRRNKAVEAGTEKAYFVDANLAAKFEARFEEPDEEEIDRTVRHG